MIEQIDITPSTGVYATYKRLSYKPWYAVAEFVDNSTQSYYDHKEELQSQEGFKKLYININYSLENDYLEITDTAFGMDFYDFKRALILDKPPNIPIISVTLLVLKEEISKEVRNIEYWNI